MSDEKPITVQILESDYRVACPADEKDALLTAAQYLNDTMLGIRDTGKVLGSERIAVMAALNISYELLNTRRQAAQVENALRQRAEELLQQLDAVLNVQQ
ncbi:MAG: cell division protein ZapA [Candidatus Competibacteraceae bacterium]|nr:cell division protein ZapA [Candidatus Competibacteraceae bacterium]MCB1805937.1 cell division protein ZapA [Candidatus Competibacteraceae bacterium]MCB1815147.1 cell division protein ZapA [Candidatus Competibacteraceae bacterium]